MFGIRSKQILTGLKIDTTMINHWTGNSPTSKIYRTGKWKPPPEGIGKINSIRASRGNLGRVSVGGIDFWCDGSPMFIDL